MNEKSLQFINEEMEQRKVGLRLASRARITHLKKRILRRKRSPRSAGIFPCFSDQTFTQQTCE